MIKVAWSPKYHHPLPNGHRFPMAKYSLLPEQLLLEGTLESSDFFEPTPASRLQVLGAHELDYFLRLQSGTLSYKEQRRIGFPHSDELVQRELLISGGTIQNALYALDYGCSLNIAGGTHHAFANYGEGFCLLNDNAIAAMELISNNLVKQILIVDLDVHQGNGTAKIFENESRVFTFSMHGKNNFPLHKEISDVDIALPDGISDPDYLKILEKTLQDLLVKVQPDFIFYLAGADVLETDKLGKLGLTLAGCKRRDEVVFSNCKKNEIPLAVNLGGGYSENIRDIIEAHANTFRLAQHFYG